MSDREPMPPPAQPGPVGAGDGEAPPPVPDDVRRRGRPVALGVALIAAGVLWMLSVMGVDLRWEVVLPIVLVLLGVLVLVSPAWGGSDGLIGLGVVVAVVALVLSVAPSPATFTAGDRSIVVTDVADLEEAYALGAGSLTLDLRQAELPVGTTRVRAGVNLGELVVLVPVDVTVEGQARVFLGEVTRFGHQAGGIGPRLRIDEPGDDPRRVLELDLRAGLGSVEVRR